MIENLEAELTGALETNSNTDNLAVAEEANVDEAITAEAKVGNDTEIDLKEECNTESYKDTMNIDIENITHLKIETKYIQLNEGQSTKL